MLSRTAAFTSWLSCSLTNACFVRSFTSVENGLIQGVEYKIWYVAFLLSM